MTTMHNRPWIGMERLSKRRVDAHTPHNLFWIIDPHGSYGLRIQTNTSIDIKEEKIKLKGIQLIRDETGSNTTDLFLILQNNEDWEIFYSLCDDLIRVVLEYFDGKEMINAIELRLKRWQQLLMQDKRSSFSIEQQMGLFSELLCLKNLVVPKVGIHQAITAWNGPSLDKQDFLLDDAVLEVKSYRTSKGDTVSISSMKQLYSDKNSIYLAVYALTASKNGNSIEELSNDIRQLITDNGTSNDLDLFESKLLAYGFAPEIINEELNNFIVDNQRIFSVTDAFPRITPHDVKDPIVSISYSIDLSKCLEFETSLENFLK
ncbi:PD-(D/E)XK motif protein [Paenibacillus medicaginis]|uniref:PD-(D/E)XK motif protein n=1 Tax=Paenibacillus medicaginis TaxID=1470560 RepID=A0ABV5C6F8_9BACL